jgi:hypothetical protein
MILAESMSQAGKQRIVGHRRKIVDLQSLGLALAACCSSTDECRPGGSRPGCKRGLRPHLVAGIDHGIDSSRQQRWPVPLVDELFDRRDDAAGVDQRDALPQSRGLGLADRLRRRLDLTIDVGLCDVVKVNQCQSGNAASRQGLGHPGPDSSQSDDSDSRFANELVVLVAVKALQSTESPLEISIVNNDNLPHFNEASLSFPACAASDCG